MMKRASIRIKGDVQMAGFRTFIKNTADSLANKLFKSTLFFLKKKSVGGKEKKFVFVVLIL